MLLELQNYFKTKKQKKEKIFIGSFVNNYLLNLYIENNIDIIRFDLEDFSLLYDYKDKRFVDFDCFRYLLNNVKFPSNIKFAVDVPFPSVYKDNTISGIVDFYTNFLFTCQFKGYPSFWIKWIRIIIEQSKAWSRVFFQL